jgi:type VI protein secretion system component VasK
MNTPTLVPTPTNTPVLSDHSLLLPSAGKMSMREINRKDEAAARWERFLINLWRHTWASKLVYYDVVGP